MAKAKAKAKVQAKIESAGRPAAPSGEGEGFVSGVLTKARARAARRAAALRERHPGESPRQLGERLVSSSAFRAGLVGAATGALSIVALPVGLPAGVALTLGAEAELLLSLLELYGIDNQGARGEARLYALWMGAGFADAAKSAGLRLGANAAGKVLAGSLPARLLARLNPVLLRAVLKRLGLGWMPRALKLWPLLGAPIGFALDRAALTALGKAALGTLDGLPAAARPPPDKEPARRKGARTRAPVVRRRSTRQD